MKENSREEDINRCNKLTETTNANWIGISNQLAIKHILSDYKRVLKENEELKEKENKIYKEVQESLAFEKFLIVKEREPDLFNQGRFYISQIIYDILNNVENSEGIHKENKYIKYIDYIPVQKVKDKIDEILNNGEYRIIFEGDAEFPDEATIINAQRYIKLEKLQELLEERKLEED